MEGNKGGTGNPAWKKGMPSANPGGRPKKDQALIQAIDDKVKKGPAWFVDKLIEIIQTAEDERLRFDALRYLMDQRYGKPAQQLDVESGGEPIKFVIETGVPDPTPLISIK